MTMVDVSLLPSRSGAFKIWLYMCKVRAYGERRGQKRPVEAKLKAF